ncbi:hypothetical protein RJ639_009917 [Escallonia herrerae]|uniref:DUF659 domain-containing protein n=1 Tax=Escallonia herrerae TaxID=1293975 RepID=A0AA89AST9_9ASTE|nr:hypothetical protein RJ639_009917 [Escallonia herrerae]
MSEQDTQKLGSTSEESEAAASLPPSHDSSLDSEALPLTSIGIEEVGPTNVIQFVSDNVLIYTAARYLIEQKYLHITKTSCAAYCLDLMLDDIDGLLEVNQVMENARKIVKFMYKYQDVLDLMRVHTGGRELKRPSTVTSIAIFCITLLSY